MKEDLHTICTRSTSLLHPRELRCWVSRGQGPRGDVWHGSATACQCVTSQSTLVRTLPVTLCSVHGATSAGRDGFTGRSHGLTRRIKKNCGGCTQRHEYRLWQPASC